MRSLLAALLALLLFAACTDDDGAASTPTPTATASAIEVTPTAPAEDQGERCAGARTDSGVLAVTVEVEGAHPEGLLHVPAGYDDLEPRPLLLLFHGGGSNPESALRSSAMGATADAEGFFVLAVPNGPTSSTRALLDHVEARWCVDAERVYAAGLSAGARFTSGIACSLPGRIAAVAPVAGAQYAAIACQEYGPVSVIALHGTDDLIVPFAGATAATERWVRHNGCSASEGEQLNALVEVERYSECEGDAEVLLVSIDGGGHQWFARPIEDDEGVVVDLNGWLWAELSRFTLTSSETQ